MGLTVENISKQFGDKLAVDNISFSLSKEKTFGLLGTNGAGKTTTVRMILGLLVQDEGDIKWNGKKMSDASVRIGYLPEERGLYPKAKISDQLFYLANLRGMQKSSAKKALDYWMERFGISEYYDRVLDTLSKGNQQKVQVIASIIHDPELIIFDEPFSGLDPLNVELLESVIRELIDNKKYIILSSHRMETIEEFCQDILLLDKGKTILQGNLKEIKKAYGRSNVQVRTQANINNIMDELGLKIVKQSKMGYELKVGSEEKARQFLETMVSRKIEFDKYEIMEPSLHEIFIDKLGDAI